MNIVCALCDLEFFTVDQLREHICLDHMKWLPYTCLRCKELAVDLLKLLKLVTKATASRKTARYSMECDCFVEKCNFLLLNEESLQSSKVVALLLNGSLKPLSFPYQYCAFPRSGSNRLTNFNNALHTAYAYNQLHSQTQYCQSWSI